MIRTAAGRGGVSWVYEVTIIFYPTGNGRGEEKGGHCKKTLCTVSTVYDFMIRISGGE